MGDVISKAAGGIGGVLGHAIASPFKAMFGASCQEVCSGPWDVICFIEHLCIFDLVKLLMILGLCYIALMFFYLLFEMGICQCIGRSLCKMCWAACETYWFALHHMTCFLWHKLKNTKRVNRRHRRHVRDIERGYISSSSESDISDHNAGRLSFSRKRKSAARGYHNHRRHSHRVRLKTREVSFHVKGNGSQRRRNAKQLRIQVRNHRRKGAGVIKRRRLR